MFHKTSVAMTCAAEAHGAAAITGAGGLGKTTLALILQSAGQIPFDVDAKHPTHSGLYVTSSILAQQGDNQKAYNAALSSKPYNRGLSCYYSRSLGNMKGWNDEEGNKEIDFLANYRLSTIFSPINRMLGDNGKDSSNIFDVAMDPKAPINRSKALLDGSRAISAFWRLFLTSEKLKECRESQLIGLDEVDQIKDMRFMLAEVLRNTMITSITTAMAESDSSRNLESRVEWALIASSNTHGDSLSDVQTELDQVSNEYEAEKLRIQVERDHNSNKRLSKNDRKTMRALETEVQRLKALEEKLSKVVALKSKFKNTGSKGKLIDLLTDMAENSPTSVLDAVILLDMLPSVLDTSSIALNLAAEVVNIASEQFRMREGSISTIRTEESGRVAGFDARLDDAVRESYVISTSRTKYSSRTLMSGFDIALAFMLFSTVRVGALNSAMTQDITYGTTLKGGLPESILIGCQSLSDAAYAMKSRIVIEMRDDFNFSTNGADVFEGGTSQTAQRMGSSSRISIVLNSIGNMEFRLKGFSELQDVPFTALKFGLNEGDLYSVDKHGLGFNVSAGYKPPTLWSLTDELQSSSSEHLEDFEGNVTPEDWRI